MTTFEITSIYKAIHGLQVLSDGSIVVTGVAAQSVNTKSTPYRLTKHNTTGDVLCTICLENEPSLSALCEMKLGGQLCLVISYR